MKTTFTVTLEPAASADAVAAALAELGDAMSAIEWGRADGAAVRAAADSMGGLDALRVASVALAQTGRKARGIAPLSAASDGYFDAFQEALR